MIKNTAAVFDRELLASKIDNNNTPAETNFSTIRQGTSTNTLSKLRVTADNTTTNLNGDATITSGKFELFIKDYACLPDIKTSTRQLFDALVITVTENGFKSPTAVIPLTDYMKRREIKNREEAKKQALADIQILRGTSIQWEEKRGKKTVSYAFVNVADSGEILRNGNIVFTFGASFFEILSNYPCMPYPAQLQTLNSKRNPNSYYLLRKIAEHKRMNCGKKNEDTIAVKTLLNSSPCLPSRVEVMATGKHLDQRIIKPFERDMNALSDTLTWSYCHSNKVPLTDNERACLTYEIFTTLYVTVNWRNYPDQTERLANKAKARKHQKKDNAK